MQSRTIQSIATTLLLVVGISACGYTVEQLVKDTPLRTRILKECVSMGLEAKDEDKCRKAAQAQAQVTGQSIKDLFK